MKSVDNKSNTSNDNTAEQAEKPAKAKKVGRSPKSPPRKKPSYQFRHVPIELIDAHPDNPRIEGLRGRVTGAICAAMKLNNDFPDYYAVVVRPKPGGRYELLKGHGQVESARKAGLATVPCWVLEGLTEAAAVEMLATSNVQAPLDNLEIGLLARNPSFSPAQGRKGEGRSAFATLMGVSAPALTRYTQGAEVFVAVRDSLGSDDVVTGCGRRRAEHLAAISAAPQEHWADLVRQCVTEKWSLKKTRAVVNSLRYPRELWIGPRRELRKAAYPSA